MAKKFLFSLGLSAILFLLAGQAVAAAYPQPATAANLGNSETTGQQLLGSQQMQGYLAQMQQGSLTPQNQMALYQMLQAQRSGMLSYYGPPANGLSAFSYSPYQAWLGLVSVITTVLVWAVLLLLISVLWHLRRKHKHS